MRSSWYWKLKDEIEQYILQISFVVKIVKLQSFYSKVEYKKKIIID